MVEGIALTSLLAQLQLSDSQFPSGAFAHSYGLEQLVREGWLVDAGGVEAFIRSLLTLQIATSDAVAAAAAAAAAHRGDLDELIRLDRALHVTKSAAELRAASCSTGRRLLEEFAVHPEVAVDLVDDFLAAHQRTHTPPPERTINPTATQRIGRIAPPLAKQVRRMARCQTWVSPLRGGTRNRDG